MKLLIFFLFLSINDLKTKLLKEGFNDSLYLKYKELCFRENQLAELKTFSLELLKSYKKEILLLITLGEIELLNKNLVSGLSYLENALKISPESNHWVLKLLAKYKIENNLEKYPFINFLIAIKKNDFKKAKAVWPFLEEGELKDYYQLLLLGNWESYDSLLIAIFNFLTNYEKSPLKEEVQELGLLLSSGKKVKEYFYSLLLLTIGEKEKAKENLKKINEDYSLIKLAEIYEKEKEIPLAISTLENVCRTKDNYFKAKAQYRLALLLLEKNEKAAIALLKDIVFNQPLTPYTYYSRELLNKLKLKGIK